MRVALDTNILVYAEGVNTLEHRAKAEDVLAAFRPEDVLVPAQVFAELFMVLNRKLTISPAVARLKVLSWSSTYATIDTSASILSDAMELTARHRIAWWDAIVMASAVSAGCRQLLSEDFQDGFTWRGVSVRNPFLAQA